MIFFTIPNGFCESTFYEIILLDFNHIRSFFKISTVIKSLPLLNFLTMKNDMITLYLIKLTGIHIIQH